MRKGTWVTALAGLTVLIGLPIVARMMRGGGQDCCAFDGGRIDALFRVQAIDSAGQEYEFCCIRCARLWCDRQRERPAAVYVTDEVSGLPVDATTAHFVRSSVITTPTRGNRIHAFQDQHAAEKHARSAKGTVLDGPAKPFQSLRPRTAQAPQDLPRNKTQAGMP